MAASIEGGGGAKDGELASLDLAVLTRVLSTILINIIRGIARETSACRSVGRCRSRREVSSVNSSNALVRRCARFGSVGGIA
jgi:hypothetical protein